MLSLSHFIASTGESPQLVGQVESTSMSEKPCLFFWNSNPLRIAALALRIFAGSVTVTLSASATPVPQKIQQQLQACAVRQFYIFVNNAGGYGEHAVPCSGV